MICFKMLLVPALLAWTLVSAQTFPLGQDPQMERFHLLAVPASSAQRLKHGDRLAICGDSITEQKMYSRLMEDYLTMCVPQLEVTVRQYGWSGERADGFLRRMTNDCLRFKPTVATTCYGMNDHEYRPYEERIGAAYRENSKAVVEAFKANGVRVIQGSPGCVGKMPAWVKSANGSVEDLNMSLAKLRNIGLELAQQERVGFADVFGPMFSAGTAARREYAPNYAIAGVDGVHPGWAGHTVMAYAFLKALGLKGDIGTFTVDLKRNRMKASNGHQVLDGRNGEFHIKSSRYPFCACVQETEAKPPYPVCAPDDVKRDSSIRSGMSLVPFDRDLNRLVLMGRNAAASRYRVTWGTESKTFSADDLARGVNLAAEFPHNPFAEAFAKVDSAVAAKQAFETREIKEMFRSQEAKADREGVAARAEAARAPLAAAIHDAFVPVTHRLTIAAE